MNNLTEKQQTIITNIISEFSKINEEKNNRPKGTLFDIDGLLGQKEADIEQRYQIQLDNEFYEEMLKDIVKNDMEQLNVDLEGLGLTTFIPKTWDQYGTIFCIDTIYQKEKWGIYTDETIRLSYQLEYEIVSFESRIASISKKSKQFKIGCYVNSSTERFYSSIEEFAADKTIIEKIKRLINKLK
jgi:hypothetical protein